jgi:glutaredoxin 3
MAEPEIIIYSTPTCQYCGMARSYLQGKGLSFTDYDVSKDEARMAEMVAMTNQGSVPVIIINGRVMVGFNRQVVDAALAKQRPPKREEVMGNLFFDIINI